MNYELTTNGDTLMLSMGGVTAPIGEIYQDRNMWRIKDAKALPVRLDQHFAATREGIIDAVRKTLDEKTKK